MSGLDADTFGWNPDPARIAQSTVTLPSAVSLGPFGRLGGSGVRFTGNTTAEWKRLPLVAPADPTAIIEVDVRVSSYPASSTAFLRVYDGATVQVELRLTTTGTVQAFDGSGSSLGSASSYVVPLNRHVRLGVAVLVHASAGTVTVQVFDAGDATPQAVLTLTGLDTQVSGSAQWTGYSLKAATTGTTDFSNLVVKDGGGTENDVLETAPHAVYALRPNGVGSHSEFIRSSGVLQYATVDDAVADDDLSYNRATESTASPPGATTDTLHFEDVPYPDQPMAFVVLALMARGLASTVEQIAHVERQSDGTLVVGDAIDLTVDYLGYLRAYNTMPDSQAFAPGVGEVANAKAATFNAYQYGYQWPEPGSP